MSDNKRDILLQDFVDNYMGKIFYFYLKKTGNSNEAEDLTQDTALNVIISLNKRIEILNFPAWIWQVARNRYSKWAKDKHITNEIISGIDIYDEDLEDDNKLVIDEMIQDEQLNIIRRELAFIKKEYREIIVAYYIENNSIRTVASNLSLSLDVVRQRLHRARNILKEGMNMVRTFGKRSYSPENISFIMNGTKGANGQPWSIINHLMYKNIFLELYENPETAEELALELGIALPYMEAELEFLVKEELLRKSGNKYETNFKIISKDEQTNIHENIIKYQKELTNKICELIDLYIKADGSKVNYSYVGLENAKWTLLLKTFDYLLFKSKPYVNEEDPKRPDGGAWTITGFELVDYKEPEFVGLHGYLCSDKRDEKYDINYGQYKCYINGLYYKTPELLTYNDVHTLLLVAKGETDKCDKIYIDYLIEKGYLKNTNNIVEPNIVIFDVKVKNNTSKESINLLNKYKSEICEILKKTPSISREYILEQALKDGWLKYDENTLPTVGAYIYK